MLWGFLLLLLFGVTSAEAVTCAVTAPPTRAKITTCYNSVTDGDTITVPAGTITDWTNTLTISKRITLQGAGEGQTIIRDSTNPRVSTITMNAPINWAGDIYANCPRLTGFTITRDPAVTSDLQTGTLQLANCVIVDHITIDSVYGQMVNTYGAVGIVADSTFTSARHGSYVHIANSGWKGVGANGDNSWAEPTAAGTAHNIYFERTHFITQGAVNAGAGFDANGQGGRYAIRFSEFVNGAEISIDGGFAAHGGAKVILDAIDRASAE